MSAGPIIIIDPRTQQAMVFWSDSEAAAKYRELADALEMSPRAAADDPRA